MGSVDDVVQRRAARIERPPVTATVINGTSDGGLLVVPLDGDTRNPIEVAFGPTILDAPAGTLVLLVFTQGGPWVAAVNRGGAS